MYIYLVCLGNIKPVDLVRIIVIIMKAKSYCVSGTLLNSVPTLSCLPHSGPVLFIFEDRKLGVGRRYSARVTQVVSIQIWPKAPSECDLDPLYRSRGGGARCPVLPG